MLSVKKKMIYSLDNFRAIAILLIVLGHCIFIDLVFFNQRTEAFNIFFIDFVHGNTALFVFITAYLTPVVFWSKLDFNYVDFLKDKTKKILLPYFFLVTVTFLFFSYIGVGFFYKNNLNFFYEWFLYLLTGKIFSSYWYIPFIFLFFILSPFYNIIYKMSLQKILLFFVFSIFLSMIIHRPYANLNPLHSLIYYTPFFLLGFYVNKNKPIFTTYKSVILSGGIFFVISYVLYMSGDVGNRHKYLFQFNGFDLMVLSKISLIVFMFSFFEIFLKDRIQLLSYFAKISFGLFFVHAPVIYFLYKFIFNKNQFLNTGIWGIFVFYILVLVLSVFIIEILKMVLKNRSKYIIGC